MLPIHRVHCSLLPEQEKSVVVYFTSEHSFMDLSCATSSRTDKRDIIYLCKYIQFKCTSPWLQCILNGETFASNWNLGGILRTTACNCWNVCEANLGSERESSDLPSPLGFEAHSTQGMAASKAFLAGVPMQDICDAAGWSTPRGAVRGGKLGRF